MAGARTALMACIRLADQPVMKKGRPDSGIASLVTDASLMEPPNTISIAAAGREACLAGGRYKRLYF